MKSLFTSALSASWTAFVFGFLPLLVLLGAAPTPTIEMLDMGPSREVHFLAAFEPGEPDGDKFAKDDEDVDAAEEQVEDGTNDTAPAEGETVAAATAPEAEKPAPEAPTTEAAPVGRREGTKDGEGAKVARKPKKKKHCTAKDSDDIRKVDTTNYVVSRSLLDFHTQSIKHIMSLGWSGPYDGDDGTKGWRIAGFGCKSDLYIGGLRRNDVVLAVNGKPTRNVVQVYGLYRKLRRNNSFEIEILRKGERKVLRYKVVENVTA